MTRMNTIPVELLRQILVVATDNDPPNADVASGTVHIGWLVTTHVSHLWREIALTTKSLWTEILLNLGVEWVKVMLERAGPTLPLSITAADRPGWDEGFYDAISLVIPNEMHRIKRLGVWGDFEELDSVYNQLDIPAPLLESLHFAKAERWDRDCDTSFAGIFAGQTPRLSYLHLDGVDLPWGSFYLFKNLKYLHIYSYGNDSGVHPLPSELLTALSHMSKLEELSFGGFVLDDWTGNDVTVLANEQRPKVELGQLRTLTMEGPQHVLDYMVKHIVCPNSCTVKLEVDTDV